MSRWPTRSATWWRATRAPTARSPPSTWPRGSASGRRSRARRSPGSPPGPRGRPASSDRAERAPSGATPRCCACCGGARWRRCAARSSRCPNGPSRASCPPGRASARKVRGAEGVAAAPSSSWRASRCRPPRWSAWSCPPGSPTTPRRSSTSSPRPARWSGAGGAPCPAATAGSPCTSRTARRSRCRRLPADLARIGGARGPRRRAGAVLPRAVRRRSARSTTGR